jgi:hypothetical protein
MAIMLIAPRNMKDHVLASGAIDALEAARNLLTAGDLEAASDWLRMAAIMAEASVAGVAEP